MNKKRTLKSRILEYVSNELRDDATYTQIIRFAHDYNHGRQAWNENPNRRGYFSGALSWRGYLVKKYSATGWLEKKPNGRYKVTTINENARK
jgi:hypothetical protein